MTINPFETGTANPLTGAAWSLTLLQGEPILPDSAITARFGADGVVSGSGGCNRYRPSYQFEGERMTVGAAAGTLMAGPPPLMQQERAYLAALQAAASYELGPDGLALKDQARCCISATKHAGHHPRRSQRWRRECSDQSRSIVGSDLHAPGAQPLMKAAVSVGPPSIRFTPSGYVRGASQKPARSAIFE